MVVSDPLIATKYCRIADALREYKKIGVAFSGGVDSTVLLKIAIATLGPESVLALHVVSALNTRRVHEACRLLIKDCFLPAVKLREIAAEPLLLPEVEYNSRQRCYACKRQLYTTLLEELGKKGWAILADGTNADDLDEDRPGLRAISELGVITPLADAGLHKREIRILAKALKLPNYDLPSNSCLATRLPVNQRISAENLCKVEESEAFLHDHGYLDCRVRLLGNEVVIEIGRKDFPGFVQSAMAEKLKIFLKSLNIVGIRQILPR